MQNPPDARRPLARLRPRAATSRGPAAATCAIGRPPAGVATGANPGAQRSRKVLARPQLGELGSTPFAPPAAQQHLSIPQLRRCGRSRVRPPLRARTKRLSAPANLLGGTEHLPRPPHSAPECGAFPARFAVAAGKNPNRIPRPDAAGGAFVRRDRCPWGRVCRPPRAVHGPVRRHPEKPCPRDRWNACRAATPTKPAPADPESIGWKFRARTVYRARRRPTPDRLLLPAPKPLRLLAVPATRRAHRAKTPRPRPPKRYPASHHHGFNLGLVR